jgi:hypothetical protein
LSTVFGAAIFFCGISIATGFEPWIPKRLKRKFIPRKTLERSIAKLDEWSWRLHAVLRPRYAKFACEKRWMRMHGLMLMTSAIVLALPLPPGGNIAPALAIATLSLGLIEEDGLFLTIGYILTLMNLIFVYLIFGFLSGFF